MTSNIDATKPASGIDQPVSVVRNNFAYAKVEIEALQDGKLDVVDGVAQYPKLANSSFPPASTHEGCAAYSLTDHVVLFSNGTNWINITTGAIVI